MKNWRYWTDLVFQFPLVVKLFTNCYFSGIKPYHLMKADFGLDHGDVSFSSKYETNKKFEGKKVLKFDIIKAESTTTEKIEKLNAFMKKHNLSFPIILKPDIGHSGMGAILIKNEQHARTFLRDTNIDYLIQEYCDYPLEYGVFYYKLEGKPNIFSINQKIIPTIIGTGNDKVKKIIKQNKETKHIKHALNKKTLKQKPALGEQIKVTNIANLNQGAIYKERTYLATPQLLQAIEEIVKDKGFNYGKIDLKVESVNEFAKGNFKIIEFNGITSLASNCYDPSYNIKQAYKILAKQYQLLLKVALENKHVKMEKLSFSKFIIKTHQVERRLKKQQKITVKYRK